MFSYLKYNKYEIMCRSIILEKDLYNDRYVVHVFFQIVSPCTKIRAMHKIWIGISSRNNSYWI